MTQKQKLELTWIGKEKRPKLESHRRLFAQQDEAQRNDLISQLEVQLQQQVEEHTLFTIEWELL